MSFMSSFQWAVPALFVMAQLTVGCGDPAKASQKAASERLAGAVALVKEDVAEVRRGLPEGAAKLSKLLGPDPGADLGGLQRAISSARAGVKDLQIAKSTFFVFTDPTGTVLRSEADPDLLATKNIFSFLPKLAKAKEASSGVVEDFGDVKDIHIRAGNDSAWAAAHPVKDEKGEVRGTFVTGWSMRGLAYHLEEMVKREVVEAAKKDGKKSVPVVYVFVLRGKKAYGAGQTPDVNTQAVEALDPLSKAQNGNFEAGLEITGRVFGIAAAKTPEYAEDMGVAIIASEI